MGSSLESFEQFIILSKSGIPIFSLNFGSKSQDEEDMDSFMGPFMSAIDLFTGWVFQEEKSNKDCRKAFSAGGKRLILNKAFLQKSNDIFITSAMIYRDHGPDFDKKVEKIIEEATQEFIHKFSDFIIEYDGIHQPERFNSFADFVKNLVSSVQKQISSPKILIVDDSVDTCDMVAEFFSMRGFDPYVANSGFEALKCVKTNDFDIVLLDFRMPGMDGLETFREMKKITPNLPTVLITAFSNEQLTLEALREGIVATLSKPVDLSEIMSRVDEFRKRG